MGIEIDRTSFTAEDYSRFHLALEANLSSLDELLSTPGFGEGGASLGAELEMYIVDAQGNPLHANTEIQAELDDPQLTLELNRYNLEYNLSPFKIAEGPFAATEREILDSLSRLQTAAARFGGRIVPIGILPTLRESDFGAECVTPRKRYHALFKQMLLRRGGEFNIDINGDDPLRTAMSDITLEGANTSFQIHYRVNPAEFADTYNAIQLVSPLALAIGSNSPMLFGHNLWHETRIPLFKQSIDTRRVDRYGWNEPARVNFGQGWLRQGALELFTEVVRIYPPLLPLCEDSAASVDSTHGGVPSLSELRLHQSTVWLWNRPVFDDADGGHLRIEMRALPAGPTAGDMVANAAFMVGLAEGIRPEIDRILPSIPFNIAEYNFYRAAQHGLQAKLVWPEVDQRGYREQPVSAIIQRLLPVAGQGLAAIGIDSAEAAHYLGVIEKRLERLQTGSEWQRARLAVLQQSMTIDDALPALLEDYMAYSAENIPVAEWNS